MTAPTSDPVEALTQVYAAHLPTWTEDGFACGACEHLFVPGGAGSYSAFAMPDEIKALIREHQATVVLDAIDSGRVPGVARVEVAKAEAEGHYHRGVQTGLKAAQVAVRAAKGEALREAKGDIKARIATFRGLDAHPEYMAALNDAWGLVANRERDARAAAPQPVDAEPVALTEEERESLLPVVRKNVGAYAAVERILRDRLAARTAPARDPLEDKVRAAWDAVSDFAGRHSASLSTAASDPRAPAFGDDWSVGEPTAETDRIAAEYCICDIAAACPVHPPVAVGTLTPAESEALARITGGHVKPFNHHPCITCAVQAEVARIVAQRMSDMDWYDGKTPGYYPTESALATAHAEETGRG